ncbi:hypothetical protein H2198_006938 [Neophaeococcomyces mojaviensis]|uniref:Uncharacterized protein n=1 Tax=Neophaeococcomyces mojaviensis TaxID=3383035 RepID=A0ACC3A200_9EURO|nr:hypothetical protein H2198_006938 [Knufia sp. JES_112]
MNDDAVLYHETAIITILVQSSFVLALNIVDHVLDKALYCGLVGQILVGMAYGTPGADILGTSLQQTVTNLGYIGLILIVFEGGLLTDMAAVRSNLVLSVMVALTGISFPIAISFSLVKMCDATTLQAFAAGCALSSTSLGTTFSVLKSSGLDHSRLGVVLTSAAMLDDVVGLVMVQVINNLGTASTGVKAAVIIRPVFVSIGYAALVPTILFVMKKISRNSWCGTLRTGRIHDVSVSSRGKFVAFTLLLLGAVTSASYAGTSALFASYLAGLVIASKSTGLSASAETLHEPKTECSNSHSKQEQERDPGQTAEESWEMVTKTKSPPRAVTCDREFSSAKPSPSGSTTGPGKQEELVLVDVGCQTVQEIQEGPANIYDLYYAGIVNKMLKPFFFGSIGFSIPISRLFDPPTLWRGVVYAVLMMFGRLACGIWLVRFSTRTSNSDGGKHEKVTAWKSLTQYRPQSLYPAGILGSAMVARGEIGFLISAIAQANGILAEPSNQGDIFLIVTWAILLCTIVGPTTVGLLTKRVKRLQSAKKQNGSGKVNALGIWGDM